MQHTYLYKPLPTYFLDQNADFKGVEHSIGVRFCLRPPNVYLPQVQRIAAHSVPQSRARTARGLNSLASSYRLAIGGSQLYRFQRLASPTNVAVI